MAKPPPGAPGKEPVTITCGLQGQFAQWMSTAGGSLIVSTYQAGKVAMIGWDGTQVGLLMRQFAKPMGLAVSGNRIAMAARHAVWMFGNAPLLARDYLEKEPGRYDALYLPRSLHMTGELNLHDLAFDPSGELWAVNTRFSCLAKLSPEFNFIPQWNPPFITMLAPEDRCHLNGLAMKDGKPKYVTALSETDSVGAWRPTKATGGIVMDVETNQVVKRGLAMPHSPRWHEGKLWVLNSGLGELWRMDPATGAHEVICALPGYLRGLCFVGNHAVIGLCQIREAHTFGGLPVQERHAKLLCAVAVVNLTTGQTVGMMEFTAGCQELYDIQFIPNVRRAMILNMEQEASVQAISAPNFAYWVRASNEVKAKDKPAATGQ